jgi:signal peptidase
MVFLRSVLSKLTSFIFFIITFFILIAAIGTFITKEPFLLSSIRSNSMYPLFERGDLIVINKYFDRERLKAGDIIIFKTSDEAANNNWIAHRIIGGNATDGYMTKGDANEYIDQENGAVPFIKPEWISNKVLAIGGNPLAIPLLGNLPLWMERFQRNPYTLPVICIILAVVIGISEMTSNKKSKKKKNRRAELALIYILSGLTISIMLGASMAATSEHFRIPYHVTEAGKGLIMGSEVGIIKVGEVVERPLSDLENNGFFSIAVVLTSNDKQISFSHQSLTLKPGQKENATIKVTARTPGKYEPIVHVGMFFPVLPKALISFLAGISYWLAVGVVALIPGLPLMLYPVWDSRMRRSVIKSFNKGMRQVRNSLPVG